VNSVLAAFVPPGVVTRTLAGPAVPAGVVHVADVREVTVSPVQALAPTVIEVAPHKSEPVTVIVVPPEVLPELGETEDTVGTGTVTNW
jgi:hypothetical protein